MVFSPSDPARGIDVTKPPYNARGDGTTDDTAAVAAALEAADEMGTDHSSNHNTDAPGETVTVFFPPGIYVAKLVLDDLNVNIWGSGPAATRFRSPADHDGYVVDARGWKGTIAHARGGGPFGNFSIEGHHEADDTLGAGGLIIGKGTTRTQAPGGFVMSNISIFGTGGPAMKVTAGSHLNRFVDITLQRPVGADTNDVPYLHWVGDSNGSVFERLGLRSVTSDADGQKVVWVQIDDSAASFFAGSPRQLLFDSPWLEFQHPPEDGSIFWLEAGGCEVRNLQAFDVSSAAENATNNSFVRFVDTAGATWPGSAHMSNRWTGHILGRGSASTSIAYGAIVEGNGNAIVGVRGHRDHHVKLTDGVKWNHVELYGADSTPANEAVDDQSGETSNTVVVWSDPTPVMAFPKLKLTGDLGFFGATPVSQPSVSGASTSDKVDSLISALDALGLIDDQTDHKKKRVN